MFLYLFVLCIIIMGGLATCATFSLFHFLATALLMEDSISHFLLCLFLFLPLIHTYTHILIRCQKS